MNHSSAHGYTDNELIAIWMGGYLIAKVYPNDRQIVKTSERGNWYSDDLKYDTSWDWLMPCCKKFCSLPPPEKWDDKVTFNLFTGDIERAIWDYLYSKGEILKIHEELAKAIKWHNNQQSK